MVKSAPIYNRSKYEKRVYWSRFLEINRTSLHRYKRYDMKFAGTVVESTNKTKFEQKLISLCKVINNQSQFSICEFNEYIFLKIYRDFYTVHLFSIEDTYKVKRVNLVDVDYSGSDYKFLYSLL